MTLSTFQSTVGNDDTGGVQVKNSSVNNTTPAFQWIGSPTPPAKTSITYNGYLIVFRLTGIPAGATINGCQIEFIPNNSAAAFTGFDFIIGNLRDDGRWSNSDGMARLNYDRLEDLPWAEWNNGASADIDVWVDRVGPAGSLANTPAVTVGVPWSIGDGTGVTPTSTITGMTDHLQLSLEETDMDDPSVCFLMYRGFEGLSEPAHEKAIRVRTNNNTNPGHQPELSIDWDPPPPTSTFVIIPQAQASPTDMTIEINGTFTDKLDDSDIGSTTTWTSDIEGLMNTGSNFKEKDMHVGVHTMTVVATDSSAQTTTTTFTITVFDVPDDLANAIVASTVDGDPNTSLQIAGGELSGPAGGGAGEKGVAVIEAEPWVQT